MKSQNVCKLSSIGKMAELVYGARFRFTWSKIPCLERGVGSNPTLVMFLHPCSTSPCSTVEMRVPPPQLEDHDVFFFLFVKFNLITTIKYRSTSESIVPACQALSTDVNSSVAAATKSRSSDPV